MNKPDNCNHFEPASGRLFLCIELPPPVRKAVSRVQKAHSKRPGISWVSGEKLHLTLRFLGPCDPDFQKALAEKLPEVTVKPFLIALQGLGVFPRKGPPKVLWAGLAPVDPLLFQLYGKLETMLWSLGVEPERRAFHPHVTIARCNHKSESEVRQVLKQETDRFESAPFRVNEFALYSSQLTSEGAIYTRLATVSFPSGISFRPGPCC